MRKIIILIAVLSFMIGCGYNVEVESKIEFPTAIAVGYHGNADSRGFDGDSITLDGNESGSVYVEIQHDRKTTIHVYVNYPGEFFYSGIKNYLIGEGEVFNDTIEITNEDLLTIIGKEFWPLLGKWRTDCTYNDNEYNLNDITEEIEFGYPSGLLYLSGTYRGEWGNEILADATIVAKDYDYHFMTSGSPFSDPLRLHNKYYDVIISEDGLTISGRGRYVSKFYPDKFTENFRFTGTKIEECPYFD